MPTTTIDTGDSPAGADFGAEAGAVSGAVEEDEAMIVCMLVMGLGRWCSRSLRWEKKFWNSCEELSAPRGAR